MLAFAERLGERAGVPALGVGRFRERLAPAGEVHHLGVLGQGQKDRLRGSFGPGGLRSAQGRELGVLLGLGDQRTDAIPGITTAGSRAAVFRSPKQKLR